MVVNSASIKAMAAPALQVTSEMQTETSPASPINIDSEPSKKLLRRSPEDDFHVELERFAKGKKASSFKKKQKQIKGTQRLVRFAERGLKNDKSPYREIAESFTNWMDRAGCKSRDCSYPPNLRLYKFAVDAKEIPTEDARKFVEAFNSWWVTWRESKKATDEAHRIKPDNTEALAPKILDKKRAQNSKAAASKRPKKTSTKGYLINRLL